MVAQLNEDRTRLQREVDALRAENARLQEELKDVRVGGDRVNQPASVGGARPPPPRAQTPGTAGLREEVEELRRNVETLQVGGWVGGRGHEI
jgi:cell division protein FtsB